MASQVLVIEDDADIAAFIRVVLEDEGYDVNVALGHAAVRLAAELRPAVVLLDLMMPGMDGFEVARHLRANPATCGLPIVVMSAAQRARHGAEQIGAQMYLAKPFSLDQLVATVATYAGAA